MRMITLINLLFKLAFVWLFFWETVFLSLLWTYTMQKKTFFLPEQLLWLKNCETGHCIDNLFEDILSVVGLRVTM